MGHLSTGEPAVIMAEEGAIIGTAEGVEVAISNFGDVKIWQERRFLTKESATV